MLSRSRWPLGAHVWRHAGRAEPGRVRGQADGAERSDDGEAVRRAAGDGEMTDSGGLDHRDG